MSHTLRLKDDKGRQWALIHDGGWTGDITFRLIRDLPDEGDSQVFEEHTLPAEIIRRACAEALTDDLTAMLEQWDGSSEATHRVITTLAKRR